MLKRLNRKNFGRFKKAVTSKLNFFFFFVFINIIIIYFHSIIFFKTKTKPKKKTKRLTPLGLVTKGNRIKVYSSGDQAFISIWHELQQVFTFVVVFSPRSKISQIRNSTFQTC